MGKILFTYSSNSRSIYYLSIFFCLFLSLELFAVEDTRIDKSQQNVIEGMNKIKPKSPCSAPDVIIDQGQLCGLIQETHNNKKVMGYLGIPFGETTSGDNRWRPPVANTGWDTKLEATENGLACPQINRFDPNVPYSEDCLSLNVWTPDINPSKPKAVVVYILGGSYLYGYNGNPVYEGSYLAAKGDIVLVTMNYRVGALGFLAGVKDESTGEEINGNFGLMDQILAMKWVKENISKFGGDPNQITLHGESAGAGSVGIHMAGQASTRELFNNVIMQSNPIGMPLRSIKESKPLAGQFADKLGCDDSDIACMRSKSAKDILSAQTMEQAGLNLLLHGMKDFLVWSPVIDNKIVNKHILREITKKYNSKPMIIGTNKNEGLLFVAYSMNKMGLDNLTDTEYSIALEVMFRSNDIRKKILKRYPQQGSNNEEVLAAVLTDYLFTCPSLYVADKSSKNTWVYLFDHIPSYNLYSVIGVSECKDAVCHGAEVPFVFHTAKNIGYEFTEDERLLSHAMINYWSNFVKNINPNDQLSGMKLSDWPRYKSDNANVILLTPINKIISKKDLKAECDFWDEIGYHKDHSFWELF